MYAVFPTDFNEHEQYNIAVDAHPTENALLINLDFVDRVTLEIDLRDGAKKLLNVTRDHASGSYRLELPSFEVSSYTLKLADTAGRFYRTFRIMKAFC